MNSPPIAATAKNAVRATVEKRRVCGPELYKSESYTQCVYFAGFRQAYLRVYFERLVNFTRAGAFAPFVPPKFARKRD